MRKFYLLYVVMCSYKNKKRIHSTLKVSSDTFGWFSFFSFLISLLSYQWNEIMKDFSIGEFSLYGLHQTPRDTFLLFRMFQCVTQYFISCKRQIKLTITVFWMASIPLTVIFWRCDVRPGCHHVHVSYRCGGYYYCCCACHAYYLCCGCADRGCCP